MTDQFSRIDPYRDPAWESLLAGIRANRADDLPRLIAADWLDEQGVHDRAEFIRLQCHLEQIQLTKDERTQLLWREHRLLSDPMSGPMWAWEACPGLVRFDFSVDAIALHGLQIIGYDRVHFRRGFPTQIHCTATEWVRYGSGILLRQPIDEVRLRGCGQLRIEEWVRNLPLLQQVPKLVITTDRPQLRRWFLEHLPESTLQLVDALE